MLPSQRRSRGRGLHSGPGGAGVLAGLRREGDHARAEGLPETGGHSGLPPRRRAAGLLRRLEHLRAGAVAGAGQLLHPPRGWHGDLSHGPTAVPEKRYEVWNRLLQPGGLQNLSQPLHRFEEAERSQHRAQQRLRASHHVRRPALPPPADSGRSPELAAQQFRQIKARRKARHGVHPAGHSQAEAPPADQRASLRHHQTLR